MRGVTAYAVHDACLDVEVCFPEGSRLEIVALPAQCGNRSSEERRNRRDVRLVTPQAIPARR